MAEIDLTIPAEPPRLAAIACDLYYHAGLKFEPADLCKLHDELDALRTDHNALFWELVGLEALARGLGSRGDALGHDQVIDLLQAQMGRFPELEDEAVGLFQDRAEAMLDRAQPLMGMVAPRQAQQHGAPAPPGTTRLSDLVPRPQLELRKPAHDRRRR